MDKAEVKEMMNLLRAVSFAPEQCSNCVAFCQEGSISVPCEGDFHPNDCEFADDINGR